MITYYFLGESEGELQDGPVFFGSLEDIKNDLRRSREEDKEYNCEDHKDTKIFKVEVTECSEQI